MNLLSQSRNHILRCSTVALVTLLLAVLNPSLTAAPADDLTAAVSAGGTADVAHASRNIFLRGFTAVALRVKPRDLPDYVAAAIKMQPDLSARIVARAVRIATRGDGRSSCRIVARILQVAVAANPDSALAIAKAAIEARPAAVHCIIEAVSAIVPDQAQEIAALETNFSLALLSVVTATSEIEPWHGSGTFNPANVLDLRPESPVVSPEQPVKQ